MKKLLGATLTLSSLLSAPAALACGMPYGDNTGFDPRQDIVISHRDGIERYQFAPSFCGQTNQFGMILPIPGDLTTKPEVGDPKLPQALAQLAAPKIVEEKSAEACTDGTGGGAAGGSNGGVQVVDTGTVGDTDYSVIKADSSKALLDWLDANKYPYDDAAKAGFEAYVSKGWSFVTFKISAASEKPAAGVSLCGELQPIVLSFPSEKPVIPTRIITAGYADWTVYVISSKAVEGNGTSTRLFAGPIGQEIADPNNPTRPVALAGEQITRLSVGLSSSSPADDVIFSEAADQSPFQATLTVKVCDPTAGGAGGAGGSGGKAGSGNGGKSGSSGQGGQPGGGSAGTSAGGTTGAGAGGASAAGASPASAGSADPEGGCSMGRRQGGAGLGLLVAGLTAWIGRRRRSNKARA